MTPHIENVNPAGVNRDGYLAEISGIVCSLIGSAFDNTLNRITMAKATRLPPQSDRDLCIGVPRYAGSEACSFRSWIPRRMGCANSR